MRDVLRFLVDDVCDRPAAPVAGHVDRVAPQDAELRSAQVLVDRAAVAPTDVARGPTQPPPEGEGVVDAPGARPAGSSPAGTKVS